MPYDVDTLYDLLPQYLRLRDTREGGPLRALVGVLAAQAELFDENLAQLYDDLFIETCADWVAPYIGTLLGVRSLQSAGDAVSPRAEVANTIGYRRRKGTALVLEQLARDVTGWPTRAVEFYDRLATTQFLNATRPGNLSFAFVRGAPRCPVGGPVFDTTPRTVEVRRITSGGGRWNLPNVGLFVWRLAPHSVTGGVAAPGPDPASFLAHPAGVDAPLIQLPDEETEWTQLAAPRQLPLPITRRVLAEDLRSSAPTLYGSGRSIFIELIDSDPGTAEARVPVPVENIRAADLSDTPHGWASQPAAAGDVAIDPELGRIRFGAPPTGKTVLVTCQHGFAANLGGGEYDRSDTLSGDPDLSIGPRDDCAAAFSALNGNATVEFTGSGRYPGMLGFTLPPRSRVVLRGANEGRPVFAPLGAWTVAATDGGELEFNGLLMTGGPLRITGPATRVRIVHCTLVPGAAPSLVVESPDCVVEIESSIVGAVRAAPGAQVRIVNSIVDAASPEMNAFSAVDGLASGGTLSLDRVTVIGRVRASALGLVTNSIIFARPGPDAPTVVCDRLQIGCLRYSLVPPDARTPRRFNCLPMASDDPDAFRPVFTSLRYGQPGYARLSDRTPFLVRIAADDRSEPGAFHDNFEGQHEANLRTRLDESLRFGLQAGLIHAT